MANTTHIRPSGVNVFDENQSLGSNEFDDNVLPQDASLSYSSANHESMALPTALVTVTASSDYDEYEQPNYSSTKKISKTKTSSLTKQLAKPKPSHFTKVIRLYNRNNHEFPKFYKLEFCSAFVTMLIWVVIFATIVVGGITLTIITLKMNLKHLNVLVPIASLLFGLFSGAFLIMFIMRYRLFVNETKTIDFSKEEKPVSMNILKIYQRAKVAHIKTHWLCGLVYAITFIALITMCMIGKIINGSMLYALDPSSGSLFFAFLIFIITFVVAFCLHVYMLISNHFRTSVIDNYYGRYIVSTEEIDKLKKKVNRKYMIIFAISIGFGVWIGWMVYKFVKKYVLHSADAKKTSIQIK